MENFNHKHYFFIKGSKRVYLEEHIFREFKRLVDHIHYDETKYRTAVWHQREFDYEHIFIEEVADASFDFSNFYIQHDLNQALYAALQSLSEDERRIIFYLYFAGFNLREVAILEGSYIMAIMRKRNKILIKLREKLEKYSCYFEN